MVSNVQVIRNLYEAPGRGDMPTVLGAMDPGIEWREAEGSPYEPGGKAWRGTGRGATEPVYEARYGMEWLHGPSWGIP